ncbi:MAG TPA: M50 family metallopeptidase [Acidimicrobiia bacterium]|nr:M50 family metallopeptidase [Acidimicrobiia bacterium]
MLGGLAAAVAIIVFVTAHEAGHFFAAKAVGMKTTQFFFGFGPKIWSTQRGETEYGVKWIPLGGYVRIVGMNPLEYVDPADVGRTYREKKFWEKSVVVLAGVAMNFLIAFLIFYGIVLANGVDVIQPAVDEIVETVDVGGEKIPTPALEAGLQSGDVLVAIGPHQIDTWEDISSALVSVGGGPTTVTVNRAGETLMLEVDLVERDSPGGSGTTGFLGIAPLIENHQPGPVEAIGIAGMQIWDGIGFTFQALGDMLRPSSLAQYLGVFAGDTDVDEEIRPVSPIGIVNIGTQAPSTGAFLAVLAFVNVILATINLLPLFPLDGGHFAVALYEKVTGREANVRKLAPVAAAVIAIFAFLGFVAIILDIVNPLSLS